MSRVFKPKSCITCGNEFQPKGASSKKCEPCRRQSVLDYGRRYRESHREGAREYNRRYHEANRDELVTRMREYRQANSDYFRNYGKRYHQVHREELLERMREYRRANPERRRQYKANRRQRISRQMTNEDRRESIEWRKTIKNDPCFYCGDFADQMHDDHMTPLARGGTDHWWNLVRSCATCNLRKNAKTAEEFIEEMTSNERSH